LIPTRTPADLFAGWWQLIERLGAAPRVLVWDGEGAIGRWRGGKVELTRECQAFRGTLASKVIVCKPADPEAKGLIERAHDYLETSFLPGRSFTSPADFNTQLQQWLALVNARPRRALGCAPTDRITSDRQAMLALPPVAPETGWRTSLRLPRDHYVRFDSNDYSVHPAVIGRRIEVVADLERVRAFCDGKLIADHERIWGWHQTISDPEHVAAAKLLRRERVGALRPVPELDVQIRCLNDYDEALGVDGGVA
jgi:transposase